MTSILVGAARETLCRILDTAHQQDAFIRRNLRRFGNRYGRQALAIYKIMPPSWSMTWRAPRSFIGNSFGCNWIISEICETFSSSGSIPLPPPLFTSVNTMLQMMLRRTSLDFTENAPISSYRRTT